MFPATQRNVPALSVSKPELYAQADILTVHGNHVEGNRNLLAMFTGEAQLNSRPHESTGTPKRETLFADPLQSRWRRIRPWIIRRGLIFYLFLAKVSIIIIIPTERIGRDFS